MSSKLRVALVTEFHDIARIASTAGSSGNAVESVQTARRTLRRARALWAMVADALPKRASRDGLDAIREARRGLSWARADARAPDLFGHLELGEAELATVAKIVANATELVPKFSEVAKLLEIAATVIATQATALEGILEALKWDEVVDGIQNQYESARDRRRNAKDTRSDFHAYRRRLRELSHQLAFVDATAGTKSLPPFAEAVKHSSAAVDLIMLRDFVKAHSHGVDEAAVDALLEAIDVPWKTQRKLALAAAGDAFSDKPKKFAKQLRASISAE